MTHYDETGTNDLNIIELYLCQPSPQGVFIA
jgi:hypothetical protein